MIQFKRAGIALALLLGIGAGMSSPALAIGQAERQALASIQQDIGKVRSMTGEFVQFGPNGSKTQGKFYIQRPGRVNFTYDRPSKIRVVADGKSVLVDDRGVRTQDLYPLSKTPLKYLLSDKFDMTRSNRVKSVSIEPDLVSVVVQDDSRFGGGTLTLVFDRNSKELRQWTVRDNQGRDTTVAVYNVREDVKLPKKLFRIDYAAARRN